MNLGARDLGLNSDPTSPKRLSQGDITDHSELQLPHPSTWDKSACGTECQESPRSTHGRVLHTVHAG